MLNILPIDCEQWNNGFAIYLTIRGFAGATGAARTGRSSSSFTTSSLGV